MKPIKITKLLVKGINPHFSQQIWNIRLGIKSYLEREKSVHLFFIGKITGKGILIVDNRKSVWRSRGYNSKKRPLLPVAKETKR